MRQKVTFNDIIILSQLGILVRANCQTLVESMARGSAYPVDDTHIYKRLKMLIKYGYVEKLWSHKDILCKGKFRMVIRSIKAISYILTRDGLECLRIERSKLLAMCDLIDKSVPP